MADNFSKSFDTSMNLNGDSEKGGVPVRKVIEETTKTTTIIGNDPEDIVTKTVTNFISHFEAINGNDGGNEGASRRNVDDTDYGQASFVSQGNENRHVSTNKPPAAGWKTGMEEVKDDDSDVQYESEEEYSYKSPPAGRQRQHSPEPSFSSSPSRYSGYMSTSTGTGGGTSHASNITAAVNRNKQKSVTIEHLAKLGNFLQVDRQSDEFKLIKEYAKNSHGLGPLGSFKIRDVYQQKIKKKEVGKPFFGSFSSKPSHHQSGEYKMLLWCKTTPEIIRKLSDDSNSCMAFYDRMARAYPLQASKMGDTRLIILLCVVNLGNVYKSKNGYAHWKMNSPSHGFDSVKGGGLYSPNWHNNQLYKKVIVPCGETQKNTRFPKYEIEFNEYMVYKAKRIEPLFAVDIEISSSKSS